MLVRSELQGKMFSYFQRIEGTYYYFQNKRPSATTGASTGRGNGHSLLTYSQAGVTLILEAIVHTRTRQRLSIVTVVLAQMVLIVCGILVKIGCADNRGEARR